MTRTLMLSLAALAVLVAAGAAFGSAAHRPSIHVQPKTAAPGGRVHVYGNVGSCSADHVTVISAAFAGDGFGETVKVRVHANHSFSTRTHLRVGLHPGKYSVGARCGGGNIGVSALIRVR